MAQDPNAISLMLCDQVIFEQGTQKPYLLGVFTGVAVVQFPTPPQRCDVFVALTDGVGEVVLTLSVTRLESDEVVYSQQMAVRFEDPLRVMNLRFAIRSLEYPEPGTYLFAISTNDREISARRVRVYQIGGSA